MLESGWTLQAESWGKAVPASVPGSVCGDLRKAGRLRDPYWRENQAEALAVMEEDFTYRCRFRPDPAVFRCPRHPYTQRLVSAIPTRTRREAMTEGCRQAARRGAPEERKEGPL